MNQDNMSAIKQEFGDDLTTPLEGWCAVTGDIIPPVTKCSRPLSASTTQSVSNQPSPPASTSNDTTESTFPPFNVNQTYPGAPGASVRANPPNGRQGLAKKVEPINNRPFIPTRNNKFVPIGSRLQRTNTAVTFNVELQLRQTREQLVEYRNAYEILEMKYDHLRLDHLELNKNCINASKSIEELKLDNAKLHDKLDQLIAKGNAQTHETSQAIPNIKQEYDDGETAQQVSDISNNELTESRQVTQIVNTQFESPPNLVDLFEVEEDEHCDTRGARKRELDCEGVDIERTVKRQTTELVNDEGGMILANEGGEQSEVNEQAINAQAEVIDQSPRQSTAEAQPNQMNNRDKQFITVHLQCPQLGCSDTFPENQLNQHMWEEHDIRPLRCLVKNCGHSFDNAIPLGRHIKDVHPDTTEWHCGKCVKHFPTYNSLSTHNVQLHQLGQFQCSFLACTFTGECKMKMYQHHTRQHKPTLSCQHAGCNYRTTKPSHFKAHQRIHSAIKPYRCKWAKCDYSNVRQSEAIKHIRRHFANSSSAPNGAQLDPKDYLEVLAELL